jgi:hypothetical protein
MKVICLEEIKGKRMLLERDIKRLIKEYEKETETRVDTIDLIREHICAPTAQSYPLVVVRCRVKL